MLMAETKTCLFKKLRKTKMIQILGIKIGINISFLQLLY